MDFMKFGWRIKQERKRQRITLEQLSEQIGISRNFLWEIEAGRKAPALPTFVKLCKGLNISADYLLGLCDDFLYLTQKGQDTVEYAPTATLADLLGQCSPQELSMICALLRTYQTEKNKKK